MIKDIFKNTIEEWIIVLSGSVIFEDPWTKPPWPQRLLYKLLLWR